MYIVYCTLYIIQRTLYAVQFTTYTVGGTLWGGTVYAVCRTVYGVRPGMVKWSVVQPYPTVSPKSIILDDSSYGR